jgi:acyl-CoA thioesterase I
MRLWTTQRNVARSKAGSGLPRGLPSDLPCGAAGLHMVAALMFVMGLGLMAFEPVRGQSTAAALRIVALGDSLTAGYLLPPQDAFPAQLQAALGKAGIAAEIANAGVSGDTASGGLERLDWSVPPEARAVILELGANDALRGVDPEKTRAALEAIIVKLKGRGIKVLLAGMAAPRNLGADYAGRFDAIYPELAAKHGLILYPFFLEGVALDPKLTLADGLHPTAAGVGLIVERMLPSVRRLLAEIAAP